MSPEHMARARTMLNDGESLGGSIGVAELLATQLAEVDRLTRAIAKCYGSDESDGLTPYEQLKSVESCWEMEHNDANRLNRELAEVKRDLGQAQQTAQVQTSEARRHKKKLADAHRGNERLSGQLAERTRERDGLASIVGSALIRASLAPGESMDTPANALTEAIEQLRGDREQLTRERDGALAKLAARPVRYIDPEEPQP